MRAYNFFFRVVVVSGLFVGCDYPGHGRTCRQRRFLVHRTWLRLFSLHLPPSGPMAGHVLAFGNRARPYISHFHIYISLKRSCLTVGRYTQQVKKKTKRGSEWCIEVLSAPCLPGMSHNLHISFCLRHWWTLLSHFKNLFIFYNLPKVKKSRAFNELIFCNKYFLNLL